MGSFRSFTLNSSLVTILLFLAVYYTGMRIKMLIILNNIDTSVFRTGMFGPGRGRSISLVDIPGWSTAPSPEDDNHLTGDRRSLSSRCVSDLSSVPDMEYGLGLLASGSPIGEHAEVDDKLLDYDSDENATHQQLALQNPADRSAMETESQCQKNTAIQIDSNVSNVILDAMYH